MKRCPECRRDYYDDTLFYCLDDGNALLEGPAVSGLAASAGDQLDNEPATAILHDTAPPSEAATRAQIHNTDCAAILSSDENATKTPAKRRRFARSLMVGLAAVLVAGAAFAYYKFAVGRAVVVSFEGATLSRVTDSGQINFAVISPDGKWLAYNFYLSGTQESIWLQQVGVAGSGIEIVKAAEISVRGISFSPDGKYIYYAATDKPDGYMTGSLYQIPVLGGSPKKVLTNISSKAEFSPDGKRIAYLYSAPGADQAAGRETRLMIANADGTEQRMLAARGGKEFFDTGPAWSPDGKSIATVHGTLDPRVARLVAVSLESGDLTTISSGRFHSIFQPTWLSDGKSLLVLAKEKSTDQSKIWQISYPSGDARKVAGESNTPGIYYLGLSLTSDSSVLATTQTTERTTLWTASTSDPTAATELKLGTDSLLRPAWTPDGKIVFSKYSGEAAELYITDPQGGNPKQLTDTKGVNSHPDVSHDGRYIVFSSDRTGDPHLWRIDIDGSNPKQLTTTDLNSGPSISPDGRNVYYTCGGTNVEPAVCRIGIEDGPAVRLTKNPASNPQISADGKRILCFYRDAPNASWKLAIIPAEGGTASKTFPLPKGLNVGPRWMPDDHSFFYSQSKDYIDNLWIQPIDGGPPKQYTNFTSLYMPWADLSRDGRVVYQRLSSIADVILISEFKK